MFSKSTRVDCYSLNVKKPLHIFKELTPDQKSVIIENLKERTEYRITITIITEEYFTYHKINEIKQLPKLLLESVPWLPSAFIDASTSGTEPATHLSWKLSHDNSISLSWKPAKAFGSNQLINQIVCYQDKEADNSLAVQTPIQADAIGYRLTDLRVGSRYKIWIEAVVCIKLNIESEDELMEEVNHYKELKDTRCINVLSEQLMMRVPAPCEPVVLNLTGYTNEKFDIYWAKPNLYSQHSYSDCPEQKFHIHRSLIGYKLHVNGIQQRTLEACETSCTLIKCKPLNTYNIVIVALTCIPNGSEEVYFSCIILVV